jgi:hypothetical protein
MAFCDSCGEEQRDGARFCRGCGTGIVSGSDRIPPGEAPAHTAAAPHPPAQASGFWPVDPNDYEDPENIVVSRRSRLGSRCS